MGIVNVTPDSFSDGGRWADRDSAVAHGVELLDQGADVLDIGGESTRPGATRPLVAEELDRVVPVIAELTARGAVVSVDTMRAEVAAAAVAAGARIVNDVSGGLADPEVLRVVADSPATYVVMHWRAHADHMDAFTDYRGGVVAGVRAELAARLKAVRAAGVPDDRLVLDPGLGFAKTSEQNWELLAGLDEIASLGLPLLVGASRKRFLGALTPAPDGSPRPVDRREHTGAALSLLLAQRGVWGLRVHDVRATLDALAVWQRLGGADGWTAWA
ncbi:dihydropteroate synthase [Nocardioides solisilvae]|uniref:dihydropteroate synthase n=1 Tax=Nocardioides solisilvae TaxID=1542435 RepID=UPI000D742145|nr:dihydropteroate synthase [Nocardioides solisilvae]